MKKVAAYLSYNKTVYTNIGNILHTLNTYTIRQDKIKNEGMRRKKNE